jgi:hypothetical protein
MLRAYAFLVIMFGPTASPVVHAQSTWHIGPTTCVLTSRSRARRESDESSDDSSHARIAGSSASSQRASAIASPAPAHTKHEARVIRSASTYVRTVPAAVAPRVIDSVSPPSLWASGTCTVSSARPVSTTAPASESSYDPSSTWSGHTETGITATPVTASAAAANGARSTDVTSPSTPTISWRARIEAGSFLRGQRTSGSVSSVARCRPRPWMDERSPRASAPRSPTTCARSATSA